ncbi:MAG: hypothetical protein J5I93_04885 [Pirellulaceae bacterium]|nr:hypothetical protein [Pirellulaceae bacterium]
MVERKASTTGYATPAGGSRGVGLAAVECALIFLLCFLLGGWLPPDVNEAHYLAKARHYWDPGWCRGDLFLESADAHLVFYWTFGWLTKWISLPAVAWTGRLLTWVLLAWSWRRLSYAVLPGPLLSVLTAAMFLPLQMLGNMAGEWVVGGVEAKGFAWVLVFLGLEGLVRQRWSRMWICFGAAGAFHVLVGGWSVAAGLVAYALAGSSRPALVGQVPGLLLGGLLSLAGLVPALLLNAGVEPAVVREANDIYVYYRLSHHLVFPYFSPLSILSHLAVAIAWAATAWGSRGEAGPRRLHGFVLGAVLIAAIGAVLGSLPYQPWLAGVLRFYWFRLADVAVPLGAALGMGLAIERWRTADRPVAAQLALVAVTLLAAAFFVHRSWQQQTDLRPAAVKQARPAGTASPAALRATYEDWVRLGEWIQTNTAPDAVFITPRMQQSFHWFAQRAEVASWKDIPQDAGTLVRWWKRIQELYPGKVRRSGLEALGTWRLDDLARTYGANYVILDRTVSRRPLAWPRVYPNSAEPNASFEVYRVP